jgi:hypothetical protein
MARAPRWRLGPEQAPDRCHDQGAEYHYSTTPNAMMVFAKFLHKTGLIKTRPAIGKEFFFPVVHNLPGT